MLQKAYVHVSSLVYRGVDPPRPRPVSLAMHYSFILHTYKTVSYTKYFSRLLLLTVVYYHNGTHFLDYRLQLFHTETGCLVLN
jgi:hypothetical protein